MSNYYGYYTQLSSSYFYQLFDWPLITIQETFQNCKFPKEKSFLESLLTSSRQQPQVVKLNFSLGVLAKTARWSDSQAGEYLR